MCDRADVEESRGQPGDEVELSNQARKRGCLRPWGLLIEGGNDHGGNVVVEAAALPGSSCGFFLEGAVGGREHRFDQTRGPPAMLLGLNL